MRYPILFCLLASFVFVSAQTFVQQEKILASDRAIYDQFGGSVTISGNYAMVGAHLEDLINDPLATNSGNGAVYVYKRNSDGSWSEVQKLVASDRAEEESRFGISVVMDGDYAVIGAPFDDFGVTGTDYTLNAGAAYIFKKEASGIWIEIAKLQSSDRIISGVFGNRVSMSGSTVAISCTGEAYSDSDSLFLGRAGAVYVFEKDASDNFTQTQRLTASDRQPYDHFGHSVAVYQNHIIVGATGHDYDSEGNYLFLSGAGYIFEKDGSGNWIETAKLVAPDRIIGDTTGESVAISENYAVIGSTGQDFDDTAGLEVINAGAVYIYKKSTGTNWEYHSKVVASDRLSAGGFGYRTILNENMLAITSARSGGVDLPNGGAVYLFELDEDENWLETQIITTSDDNLEAVSVKGVALNEGTLFMGAPGASLNSSGGDALSHSGAVYYFNNGTISTGIEDLASAQFMVYPNPASNFVFVDLERSYKDITASLISIDGKVLDRKYFDQVSQFKFELDNNLGTYLLEIKTASGIQSVRKVISRGH